MVRLILGCPQIMLFNIGPALTVRILPSWDLETHRVQKAQPDLQHNLEYEKKTGGEGEPQANFICTRSHFGMGMVWMDLSLSCAPFAATLSVARFRRDGYERSAG